jgi:hypothetical protein
MCRTIVALQHAHGGQARRHAHGSGIEGARTHYSVGTQQLEDVRPTCYSRQRHATCNGLAKAGQIGGDAVMALRTAKAHAKACDDLVNAKDHTVLCAKFTHPLEVTRAWDAAATIGHDSFHHD